jgi:hypothetical protein
MAMSCVMWREDVSTTARAVMRDRGLSSRGMGKEKGRGKGPDLKVRVT